MMVQILVIGEAPQPFVAARWPFLIVVSPRAYPPFRLFVVNRPPLGKINDKITADL